MSAPYSDRSIVLDYVIAGIWVASAILRGFGEQWYSALAAAFIAFLFFQIAGYKKEINQYAAVILSGRWKA
jgi:hypothetical protein